MGIFGDIGEKVKDIGSEAYRRMKADEPVFGKGIAKFGKTLTDLGTVWDPDGGPAEYSKLKDERELSNALQNESLAKTRKLNAEAAAFEESQVDFGEFFNQVRDGGGGWNNKVVTDLEEATKKLLPFADLNGDKITTKPEWAKALRENIVPVGKISEVLEIAITNSKPLLNEAQGNVYKLLNELNSTGGTPVTREMFMNNPGLASTSPKHRKAYEAIMKLKQLDNQMNGFHTTKTELANITKNLEYGQTQNYAINKFLDTPGVREDMKDAEQWIREIRNSKKTNESGEKFVTVRVEGATSSSTLTEQEVIDGIENKYDVKGGLGQWLRSRLGQVSDDRSLAL
jgi:hypothetical protein